MQIKYFCTILLLFSFLFSFTQTDNKEENMSKISQKEFEKIVNTSTTSILIDLCDEDFDVYITIDGKVILKDVFEKGAIVYSSKEEYLRVLNEFSLESKSNRDSIEHILFNFQEEIINIPNKNVDLIEEFLITLKINFLENDTLILEKYLDEVNEKVSRNKNKDKYLENNFIPLTIIIGELIKNRTDGKWFVKYDDYNPNLKEIYIESSSKQLYNPWIDIYKILYERKDVNVGSIVEVLLMRLDSSN